MAFGGFPKGTAKFLTALAKNNDRAWLQKNRKAYDEDLIEPALAFVEAMGPKLQKISRGIQADPKVGGSVMRMNRDTRFSKDKTPYKTHLDIFFWEGDKKGWDRPGFFFRFQPPKLMVGAGIHGFDKPLLTAFRAAVMDAKKGAALVKAIAAVEKAGATVGGLHYKKVPTGLPADHPRAELLRYQGLHAGFDAKAPAEMNGPEFIDWCAAKWKAMSPLHEWLLPVAGEASPGR